MVEMALSVPLLLVLLLGMTDLGRAFYYSSAVASAARTGAAAYAADSGTNVQAKACGSLGSGCVASVVSACPSAPVSNESVEVRYHFELVSGFLAGYFSIFSQRDIRACATYPRTGP